MPAFLIVEDDVCTSRALSNSLAILGLGRSDQAANAMSARTAVRNRAYDIIFLDLNLPEPVGESLLREFIDLRPTQAVVVVTAMNEVEVAVRCLQSGARDYLIKPCLQAGIIAAVNRARQSCQVVIGSGSVLPSVDDVTDAVIQAALERTQGHLARAAQLVGMSRSGLVKRMAKRQLGS